MENIIELKLSSKRWEVLQPPIYLISILPGLVWAILLPDSAPKRWLALTTLAVVLIQHGVNVLNDAIDWKKGADSQKELSWVHFHSMNLTEVKLHGALSFAVGVLLGVGIVCHLQAYTVLFVALPLVLLGYGYNASQWTLSYTSLGEWVTGLCYGPGVFGCMGYLFLGKVSVSIALGSVAFGFLAVAVLFSHQPPQILNDFLAGKSSFAVRHGAEKTFWVSRLLVLSSLLILSVIFCLNLHNPLFIVTTIFCVLISIYRLIRSQTSPKLILSSTLWVVVAALVFSWGDKNL